MIPDLKMGMIDATFSCFGNIPCDNDKFMMWVRRGLKVVLLSLISKAGRLS